MLSGLPDHGLEVAIGAVILLVMSEPTQEDCCQADEDDQLEPLLQQVTSAYEVLRTRWLYGTVIIPDPPADPDETSYWHFGYPISLPNLRDLVQECFPEDYTAHMHDPSKWLPIVEASASLTSGWPHIRHVFVQGDVDMQGEEWQTSYEEPTSVPWVSGRVVSFYCFASTFDPWMMQVLPCGRHLEVYDNIFQEKPRWMKDAFTKENARDFYRFEV
ncbi:hypothetical protein HDZ31DRAFT_59704 [Schizophyllum fasciatum]